MIKISESNEWVMVEFKEKQDYDLFVQNLLGFLEDYLDIGTEEKIYNDFDRQSYVYILVNLRKMYDEDTNIFIQDRWNISEEQWQNLIKNVHECAEEREG